MHEETKLGKPIKLALFREVSSRVSWETVFPEHMDGSSTYVRISEFAEVTFEKLHDDAVIRGCIDALDRSERQIRLEFQKKLDDLSTQKQNLLALTHKPA